MYIEVGKGAVATYSTSSKFETCRRVVGSDATQPGESDVELKAALAGSQRDGDGELGGGRGRLEGREIRRVEAGRNRRRSSSIRGKAGL